LLHRYVVVGDPAYQLRVSERLTLMPEGFELTLSPRAPAMATAVRAASDTVTRC
jgi:unspecific monooxygenase